MRTVVTGAGGFIGWHLTHALARRGDSVQAWARNFDDHDGHAIEVVPVNITNRAAIQHTLDSFLPDLIIHLAGQSFPGLSWENPALTYEVNVLGAIHLLESVRGLANRPRLLIMGSSAEYAERTDGKPIAEGDAIGPNSPYGASKHAVDELVELYVRRYDMDAIRVRPFYLTGPRKSGDVSSDFARRIVAIERGAENILRVGSLDVVRDLLDIRDAVRGILLIAEAGVSGRVYNLCSGTPVKIAKILEIYRGLTAVELNIVMDTALVRPLEQKIKVGDPTSLQRLGWNRECTLRDTLSSILNYLRQTDIQRR